ncbi:MAG: prepilin-type N-terminal cleavage/methylation domain-containing protein [Planctomycetota bacterium]|jgi:type II secretory pathway pseudopilin PulG
MKMNKKKQSSGFTLIEALIAAMLLGLVVAALAAASGAFTMANGYGVDLTTAEFLIEEMREYTATQSFDELLADPAYNAGPISPPIDVSGTAMADFGGFSQQVVIKHVQSGNFDLDDPTATSDFVRVKVTITKNGQEISSTSWIRARL